MTQADRFSEEEIKQMFAAFPPDVCGNLDYRNLCYVITHGKVGKEGPPSAWSFPAQDAREKLCEHRWEGPRLGRREF
ncbi:hypothetical protein QTO34_013631 [Cnephaeus nilssonii]|uniref:Uncharacterized protein n=1 Tax=Cnephaeus nilssonii TaxID=3371016 RepID=A0AA40LV19_CNENI|nr:hypothetical protein QTO34_013631 [Eptesicus nilssonii]